jgi:hypothetical protein
VSELIKAKRLTPQGVILPFQPKLTVGAADDQYEKQADAVARRVVSMPDSELQPALSADTGDVHDLQRYPLSATITQVAQRSLEDGEDSQRRRSEGPNLGSFDAGTAVEAEINRSKGQGSPLPDHVSAFMEPRFGADFSHVRVHTGSDAIQMNQAIGAQAFTHGSDIYFGEGQSPSNLELTAHEMTHVVQQTGGAAFTRDASSVQRQQQEYADLGGPLSGPPYARPMGAVHAMDPAERVEERPASQPAPTPFAAQNWTAAMLALQQSAGNHPVANLLARKPHKGKQNGSAKAPPPAKTPDPNAEPFTDAQLERMGEAAQVNVLFNDIEKLKNERIETWKATASTKEPKPLREALDIVVSMVGLGMGGVFGMFVSEGMAGKFLKDFVYLAGLELVSKATEDSYMYGMRAAGDTISAATTNGVNSRRTSIDAALASDKDDLLGTYAEAVRLQARVETQEQQSQFNLNAKKTYRRGKLVFQGLVLRIFYNQLLSDPQVFHHELTEGLVRLMDEQYVAGEAKDYGGDKGQAREKDEDLHETAERKGNLLVLPEKVSFSLGTYGNPNLNFGNYYAFATGANTKTLMKLAGTPVKDLKLSLGFRYWVEDPFYRILKGDMVKAWFTRDPAGGIQLDDLGESAMEWLASYYSGESRELTDDERKKWAPEGAKKLYEATKDRPITRLSNSDRLSM